MSHALNCSRKTKKEKDVHSGVAAGAHDISGGGNRHWLACRPMPGPNDAGLGSVVRRVNGWDCGKYSLKEHG